MHWGIVLKRFPDLKPTSVIRCFRLRGCASSLWTLIPSYEHLVIRKFTRLFTHAHVILNARIKPNKASLSINDGEKVSKQTKSILKSISNSSRMDAIELRKGYDALGAIHGKNKQIEEPLGDHDVCRCLVISQQGDVTVCGTSLPNILLLS
jgi:hypothetical protein